MHRAAGRPEDWRRAFRFHFLSANANSAMNFPPAPRPVPVWMKRPAWAVLHAGFAVCGAALVPVGFAAGMPDASVAGGLLIVLGGVMEWQRRRSPAAD